MKIDQNNFLQLIDIPTSSIMNNISLNFINKLDNYANESCSLSNDNLCNVAKTIIYLPICFSYLESLRLGKLILATALIEKTIIRFFATY